MSEEKNIRINKVLRELNISLERAVDYLKDKGIAIEASPNTKISDDVYNVLCGQFAGDKGNKEASKEVSEEKRKEKEALRVEREKEIEDKRKQDEERQRQEVIKAKAVVTGPVQVRKIDLNPKIVVPAKEVEKPISKQTVEVENKKEKPVANKPVEDKKDIKPIEIVAEPKAVTSETETPVEESITTQYQKLSGATLTGQTIDLSQFNKPKKKKEEPKITPNKPGATPPAGAGSNANKNKRKRIPTKPGAPRPTGTGAPGTNNPSGNNINRSARPGFVKGNRPAIVAKVEPTKINK